MFPYRYTAPFVSKRLINSFFIKLTTPARPSENGFMVVAIFRLYISPLYRELCMHEYIWLRQWEKGPYVIFYKTEKRRHKRWMFDHYSGVFRPHVTLYYKWTNKNVYARLFWIKNKVVVKIWNIVLFSLIFYLFIDFCFSDFVLV